MAREPKQASSYHGVPHLEVMHKASVAIATGADFDRPTAVGILAAMGSFDRETVE